MYLNNKTDKKDFNQNWLHVRDVPETRHFTEIEIQNTIQINKKPVCLQKYVKNCNRKYFYSYSFELFLSVYIPPLLFPS